MEVVGILWLYLGFYLRFEEVFRIYTALTCLVEGIGVRKVFLRVPGGCLTRFLHFEQVEWELLGFYGCIYGSTEGLRRILQFIHL